MHSPSQLAVARLTCETLLASRTCLEHSAVIDNITSNTVEARVQLTVASDVRQLVGLHSGATACALISRVCFVVTISDTAIRPSVRPSVCPMR